MNHLPSTISHAEMMDEVYRYQRHIYDLTRKYYLLGRDRLIEGLKVPDRANILEIGCGDGDLFSTQLLKAIFYLTKID